MILTQPLAKDHWKHSFDSYDAPIIGRGSSGYVFEIDQDLVFKEFSEDEEGQLDFERETSIYGDLQRGSGSPYITKLIEKWRDGLVLERHSCTLRSRLQEKRPFSIERRTQWVIEACKGLAFLHQNGIMHGDVGCHNFLVDKEGYIKLCDFAGSKRKGEIARVCYEVRGQHPDYRVGQPTSTTEVFSLGSTIFEICTSHAPYSSETDAVVRQKYRARDFPLSSIDCPKLREVVEKCWMGEYVDVSEICDDLSSD